MIEILLSINFEYDRLLQTWKMNIEYVTYILKVLPYGPSKKGVKKKTGNPINLNYPIQIVSFVLVRKLNRVISSSK